MQRLFSILVRAVTGTMQQGAVTGMQQGAVTGMQQGAVTGMQTGAVMGAVQPGAVTGVQSGAVAPGAVTGMEAHAFVGIQHGAVRATAETGAFCLDICNGSAAAVVTVVIAGLLAQVLSTPAGQQVLLTFAWAPLPVLVCSALYAARAYWVASSRPAADPSMNTPLSLKGQLLQEAECSGADAKASPPVYQLRLRSSREDPQWKLRLCELGDDLGRPCRTLMVVGATGAGKTTWLNALANYLVGVTWEDNFRFRLIQEASTEQNQAQSQTAWVTAYKLHWRPGFKVEYSVMVIDTPGYGDTRGPDRDKHTTEQLRHFLGAKGPGLVQEVHAIGFVLNATLARLSHQENYIYHSILALFGKDIADNILVLATFADGRPPAVMAAMKEADIPYRLLLKFNNSALFAANAFAGQEANEDDMAGSSFNSMFWQLGTSSFTRFFKQFQDLRGRSLDMTQQVLSERELLEKRVAAIAEGVKVGLSKADTVRQEIAILNRYKSEMSSNKNFETMVPMDEHNLVPLPQGVYVTNCLVCNFTCHDNCAYSNDEDKAKCCVMDSSGRCSVCTKRCHWQEHRNTPYRYVIERVMKPTTLQEIKEKYETAQKQTFTQEGLINAMVNEYLKLQMKVYQDVNEMRKGLNRLKEIALRPDPLSQVDYVKILIDSERHTAKPGFQERIAQLEQILDQAKTLADLARDDYDPFAESASAAGTWSPFATQHMTVAVPHPRPEMQTWLMKWMQDARMFLGL